MAYVPAPLKFRSGIETPTIKIVNGKPSISWMHHGQERELDLNMLYELMADFYLLNGDKKDGKVCNNE